MTYSTGLVTGCVAKVYLCASRAGFEDFADSAGFEID
jgi:hypothetical protein